MEIALWLCMVPIVWTLIARFALPKTITWKEALLQGGIAALFVLMVYGIMAWSNLTDRQILNGYVTGKEKNWVSCSHSYRCNCYTTCSGSGGSRTCSEHCSTCYEHINDWDWDVSTTVGNLTINRVDRRGSNTPPRWSAVLIGEPAALEQSYINYVKGSPNSLFNMQVAEDESKTKAALIPAYPSVYDYYRVNHTISVNAKIPNINTWDDLLDKELKKLGAAKQVNVVMVFVEGQGLEYASMLERAWLGGKKNDVVIVVGTTGTKINWVEAFTFGKTSGNGMLAVQIRTNLTELGSTTDARKGVSIVSAAIQHYFKRKEMANYEYLKAEGGPSSKQTGWLIGIVLFLLMVSTFLLWKYDVFSEGSRLNRYIRYR